MTLTQLEYFCMVCRYHSITRAAKALYVSQPTISTSIRDLEKEFHLKLFNHGKNRISLTKDGEAFYQKAEYILKQTQELYADFSNIEENRPPLRIGIPPMISTVFFPRVTDQFQEQYHIPIQLLEYGSIRARSMIDNEQLDVAMANMDFYNLGKYNSYTIMKDRYVYCVHKTHRYAHEKEITMEMLKDEPIILFNTDCYYPDAFCWNHSQYSYVLQPVGHYPELHPWWQMWSFSIFLPYCQPGRFLVNSCLSGVFQQVWYYMEKGDFYTRTSDKVYNIYKRIRCNIIFS